MTASQVVFYVWMLFSFYWVIISFGRKKRSDKDRATIISILCVIVALLSEKASAQTDHRWRLIQGTDSIVEVPLADLRIAGALRAAKNEETRRKAWEVGMQDQNMIELRSVISNMKAAAKIQQAEIASQTDEIRNLRDSLRKANRKIKRRNPFTPLLIGVVGGIVIQQSIQ